VSACRVLAVVGTRPEAIKMAPVVLRLLAEADRFTTVLCSTAQHREMVDRALAPFGLRPDIDLDVMRPDQSLNEIAGRVFERMDPVLVEHAPDVVVVQGDTTTVLAVSLAAFHRGVPVAHVEAGLRTGDLTRPCPEEMNRRVTDLVAAYHFAPTPRSARALHAEGIAPQRIHVTGNTVVDALQWISRGSAGEAPGDALVLVTMHRRESFGEPMRRSLQAVRRLAERFPALRFVLPVHPNPRVVQAVEALAGLPNVDRVAPADYPQLVRWLRSARLVITDSGGLQEEAPAFGVPTLVLRQVTERPEGVEAGVAKLVGTDEETILREAERILADPAAHAAMARAANPYGDGRAAERIVAVLAGLPMTPFEPAAAR
jgi:UDP-N-acetylglucosamine 2-epimerase (non-hydrolysing)